MTTEHEASRTLVKSPPELWAECSDAGSLARHLGEFGEITITRLEPETTVAWEGEHASGTVRIEPSGWGTRVTLTAHTAAEQPPQPEVMAEAEPPADGEAEAGLEPVCVEPQLDQEESDATVEETAEGTVGLPVAEAGRAPARWRRITAGLRRYFSLSEVADELGEAGNEESPKSGETVSPAPAPLPHELARGVTPLEEPVEREAELAPELQSEPTPSPAPVEPELDAEAILTGALDSLGQAHHRPFSRA